MSRNKKRFFESDKSGQRVRVNGAGRLWTEEYMGQTGILLGDDTATWGVIVRLDGGEEVQFYSDEIDPV